MKTISFNTTTAAARLSVIVYCLLFIGLPSSLKAQELQYSQSDQPVENTQNKVEGTVGLDLVSHYMWRGTDKGNITILPYAQVSWQGAFLKLHGATGISHDDPKEINISLGYKYKFNDFLTMNAGVTDYWTSGKDFEGRNLYFEWDPVKNGHQLEANLGFDFGYFQLQGYTMVWGNDFKYETLDDVENRTNGKRAWSTFIELRVPFYLGGIDWDVCAGMTPFESAYIVTPLTSIGTISLVHKEPFYSDKTSFIMASLRATKRLEIGDVKVPIFAELHTNPYMKRANFLIGVSVQPF